MVKHEKICEVCGKLFVSEKPESHLCSRHCQMIYVNQKLKEKDIEAYRSMKRKANANKTRNGNTSLDWNLPQTCYFCKKEIDKRGKSDDTLAYHSLDGNHYNWDLKNKVPTHAGCHSTYHLMLDGRRIRNSERMKKHNPMKNPEIAKRATRPSEARTQASQKRWENRVKKYGLSGYKSGKNPMSDPMVYQRWREAIDKPEHRVKLSGSIKGKIHGKKRKILYSY